MREQTVDELINLPWTRVFTSDSNGWISASIAELPGCLTEGKTQSEADENLTEALELWLLASIDSGYEFQLPKEL